MRGFALLTGALTVMGASAYGGWLARGKWYERKAVGAILRRGYVQKAWDEVHATKTKESLSFVTHRDGRCFCGDGFEIDCCLTLFCDGAGDI